MYEDRNIKSVDSGVAHICTSAQVYSIFYTNDFIDSRTTTERKEYC